MSQQRAQDHGYAPGHVMTLTIDPLDVLKGLEMAHPQPGATRRREPQSIRRGLEK